MRIKSYFAFISILIMVFSAPFLASSKTSQESTRSIANKIETIIKEEGIHAALLRYRELRLSTPQEYDFSIEELNKLGQKLFRQKKREEAVRILELNEEMYPDTPKILNLLAQMYFFTGRRQQSKACFTRFLELEPNISLNNEIFRKRLYFVPDEFEIPLWLETEQFRIRPLRGTDVDLDYKAVMSSIDHIKGIMGGRWPTADLTREQNKTSLINHEKDFVRRSSFTYTVMNLDETECLGCIYIYPSRLDDYNAEVTLWVTQSEFDRGLDPILVSTVKEWLKTKWIFKKVIFPGREMPWGKFFQRLDEQDKKFKKAPTEACL